MVEEELFDRHEGERLVKINLSSDSCVIKDTKRFSKAKSGDFLNLKSVPKPHNTSDSLTQVIVDKSINVGFKLDKECQTDLSQDLDAKHTSITLQTSTEEDDEDTTTSQCSCLENHRNENSRSCLQINGDDCFHASEHLKYIDCDGDDNNDPSVDQKNEFQRGLAMKFINF